MSDSPFDQEVTLRLELSRSDSRMAVGLCVLSASTGAWVQVPKIGSAGPVRVVSGGR